MTDEETQGPRVDLDYAYVANYAKINNDGTITALESGFLKLAVIDPETRGVEFAIAGRARFFGGLASAELGVTITPPSQVPIETGIPLVPAPDASYGDDGRRHVMFCVNVRTIMGGWGPVEILLHLDGKLVRRLLFDVVPVPG